MEGRGGGRPHIASPLSENLALHVSYSKRTIGVQPVTLAFLDNISMGKYNEQTTSLNTCSMVYLVQLTGEKHSDLINCYSCCHGYRCSCGHGGHGDDHYYHHYYYHCRDVYTSCCYSGRSQITGVSCDCLNSKMEENSSQRYETKASWVWQLKIHFLAGRVSPLCAHLDSIQLVCITESS